MAYYLSEKGYDVTVIERNSTRRRPGADVQLQRPPLRVRAAHLVLARRQGRSRSTPRSSSSPTTSCSTSTAGCSRSSRPTGGSTAIRCTIRTSTQMPDKEQIYREVRQNRDAHLKLIESQLPRDRPLQVRRLLHRGDRPRRCTGSSWRTTPGRCGTFPATSSRRRWSGPIASTTRTRRPGATERGTRARRLRSAEVRGPHARQGHPVPGLPEARLERRLGRDGGALDGRPRSHRRHRGRAQAACTSCSRAASGYHFADYHTVFCSIDIDELWGENTLPYTGRMMIPLLIPGLWSTRFPTAPNRCTTRRASFRRA